MDMGGFFGEYATVGQVQRAVQCLVRRMLWDTRFASLSLDFSGTFSFPGHRARAAGTDLMAGCTIRQFMQAPTQQQQVNTTGDRAPHTLF